MSPQKISIIIPALNEADYLPRTIRHTMDVAKHHHLLEVLVIDAGSTDGTIERMADYPVQVFSKPEFVLKKFESLNFGIQQASGELLVFLDADTLLPDQFDELIRKALHQKKVIGGAFEFAFYPVDFWLKIIEWINRLRYRIDGVYFGDQAIFCRQEVARKVNGFPENELMDAAFFCRRLKKEGKLMLIKKHVTTSSRRFRKNGYFRMFWFDFSMWIRFHITGTTKKQRERYWNFNRNE